MAGRGKPPKKPEVRHRRNVPPPLDPLPAEGNAGAIPPLRKNYRVLVFDAKKAKHVTRYVPFLSETKAWYAEWGRSPMAVEFTDVHWRRLADIAILQDRWFRSSDIDVLKELRLQLAAFGGTPADLLRLGKTVKPGGAGKTPVAPSGGDRRARLQAVPDAA